VPSSFARLVLAACLVAMASCGGAAARGAPVTLAFPGLGGQPIDLVALRGRVVVVHIFTVGSIAALADVDPLNAAVARYGERIAVIGVVLELDGWPFLRAWRDESGARYPIGLGDRAVATGQSELGRIAVVPTTFVLDAAGRIAARLDGQLRPGQLQTQLYRLLGSG
jgi:hypothetical protein